MKPSLIKETLKVLLKARVSVYLWGVPGGGKSSIIYQLTKEMRKTLFEMRALLYEPIDVRGFPKITKDDMTIYCPPEDLPRGLNCLLFLDELNQAPMLTQNSFLQLTIPPYKLGSYQLPKDCGIVAAGNHETHRAGSTRMGTALANRFVHLNYDIDTEEWLDWAIENDLSPINWAFIKYRSELLCTFDPKKDEKAFASPRSHEMLSNIVNEGLFNLPREAQLETAAGTIGQGPATEFIAFADIWQSLPDPEEVIKSPTIVPIPDKPAVLFALCGALSRKVTKKNVDNFFTFAGRLSGEWSVRLVNDASKFDPSIKSTRAYAVWVSKYSKLMI